MRTRTASLLYVFFFCLTLSGSAQDIRADDSVLNGNWLLTGGWEVPLQKPRLTLSMGVSGREVYGRGDLQLNGCGVSFGVTGEIAPDGSFVLSNSEYLPGSSQHISISGRVPAKNSTEWSGSFSTSSDETTKCWKLSGGFVASQLPQLHGTYSGRFRQLRETGSGRIVSPIRSSSTQKFIDISVSMTQGIFTSMDEGEFSSPELSPELSPDARISHYLALTGTIVVRGTDLPYTDISASATADYRSRIKGDQFTLFYPLSDGTTMSLAGILTDSTERTMVAWLTFTGKDGKSKTLGMGNLTQP